MDRRTFLAASVSGVMLQTLQAKSADSHWDAAIQVLEQATKSRQVQSAVLHILHRGTPFTRVFGKAQSEHAMFLLGSITKPINVAAVMTLFDRGEFQLDDKVAKYLPEFRGDGRDAVTIRHLLTHVSGLPDQLANNNDLRARQAPLSDFVKEALRTPLAFAPGSRYQYSSMGILLATRIAEVLSGMPIAQLVDRTVFQPLKMQHSAQGLGAFKLEDMVPCQMEGAAPESGSGDPQAKNWDWNSTYWRNLGAPWGGTHASALDVGKFLNEFLGMRGQVVKPETACMMIQNQNPMDIMPRGLGFAVGRTAGSPGCSERTFGHTGSTGTLCWADPSSETICVILTSLPRRGAERHPREQASDAVAKAMQS